MEVGLAAMEHRWSSEDPPEASRWEREVPESERSDEVPTIPRLLPMRVDPRRRSTERKDWPWSRLAPDIASQVNKTKGREVIPKPISRSHSS